MTNIWAIFFYSIEHILHSVFEIANRKSEISVLMFRGSLSNFLAQNIYFFIHNYFRKLPSIENAENDRNISSNSNSSTNKLDQCE